MSGVSLTLRAGGVLSVTLKRADQLRTGDLLWRDETQRWHEVFVLPTQPVAVPIPGGMEICTNLHLVPNPKGPQSIATYTLPVGHVVLTATDRGERDAPGDPAFRDALERIGWHELTAREARDVARAALEDAGREPPA